MNKLKKITATILAMLCIASVGAIAGCGDKKPTPPPATECDVKGHGYDEKTGLCVRCEKKAVIPSVPSKQTFPLVAPCTHDGNQCNQCDYEGSGENMWNRLQLFEDCYTVEIGSKGQLWLSFSVKKAGQYVLHSVGGDNGVKATRHAANDSYVNEKGIPAVEEEGNFYAYDNCGENYYNAAWRSTYCLKAPVGTRVKIRFIRIDEPAWEPASIHTKVYAEELTEKAQNAPDDKELIDVPYDSEYFFDESLGYYRMGTASNPGEIIYAAIDKAAPRLFGEATEGEGTKFTNILKTSGTALNIGNGTTENGDYNILNYLPFIMNWKDENATWGSRPGSTSEEPEGDPDKVCYQNYCNDDGVYPVNKELFTFLNLYVSANSPADEEVSTEEWVAKKDYLWLSACYYYGQIQSGTQANPLKVEAGNLTVNIPEFDYLYLIILDEGTYTIQCANADIRISVSGDAEQAIPTEGITITVSPDDPVAFTLSHVSGLEVKDLAFTVTKN